MDNQPTPDVDAVLDAVVEGRLDHELESLWQAIHARQEERYRSFTWEFELPHPCDDGATITFGDQDLTLDEWCTVQDITRTKWTWIEPVENVEHMRAVISAVFEHRAGMTRSEALAAAGPLAGDAMVQAMRQVDVEGLRKRMRQAEVARRPLSGGRSRRTSTTS